MKRLLLFICLIASVCSLSVKAQIRGNNIAVTVTPDHQNWNYSVGQQAKFTVNVLRSGTLIDTVTASKELSPYQLNGHYWFQEQWDEWEAWLLKQMEISTNK